MTAAHEAQWSGTQPQQMSRKQKLQVAWPAAPQQTEQDGFTQQRRATPAIDGHKDTHARTHMHFLKLGANGARAYGAYIYLCCLQHGCSQSLSRREWKLSVSPVFWPRLRLLLLLGAHAFFFSLSISYAVYKASHQSVLAVLRAMPASKRSSRGRPYFSIKAPPSAALMPRARAAFQTQAQASSAMPACARS